MKITTLTFARPKVHLFLAGRVWTASFDYSKIKYTEDYYDVDMNPEAEPTIPEWKVYFDGDFWGHSGKDRSGTELRLNKQFDWAGHHWVIPAAYSCSKGLVMDFCMRTPEDDIRKFMTKWDLHPENNANLPRLLGGL